jgi:hypothetical protein
MQLGNIPTKAQAEEFLREAAARNPGPWEAHSKYVGKAAAALIKAIPGQLAGMDSSVAYILGILHDIGRRAGVTGMRHVIDGYYFLQSKGFDGAARICLTHSYPIKLVASGSADWDGTQEEYEFVQAYLDSVEYCRYDRLIQLCDTLTMASGYCLIEKRMVDVARRYGVNEYTVPKWESIFEIKHEFERILGKPVYSILPGVVENTFGSATETWARKTEDD